MQESILFEMVYEFVLGVSNCYSERKKIW